MKHRIRATYDGCTHLLIVLHDPQLADHAQQEADYVRTADDALLLVRHYSELAYYRDQDTVKATNNNYSRLRKARLAEKPLNWSDE